MNKVMLIIISSLVLGYSVVSVYRSQPVKESALPVAAPPQTLLVRSVAGVGLVEAASENIFVSTPVSGLVKNVYVKAGDMVKKGQKLFDLDDRDLRAALVVRSKTLEVAKSRLEKLTQSPRPEEIPVLEAKVKETESLLADATVQLKVMESVSDKRAIRDEELQRRRIAVKTAQAKLDQSRADLGLLKAGSWQVDIEVARAEIALAESQVKQVQTDIERLTVVAPVSGQILQSNIHPGEYATSGQIQKPLMMIGDLSSLHIRVDIDESNARWIESGAPAEAVVRGASDKKLSLEFVRFEPYVTPKKSLTGESTERVDTRVLQVIYRIKDKNKSLYVGQQMDVFIASGGEK
ncbi:MAG: efflux RND transporter periplasmic adaptor subunit [Blastocatellia bacterium]|nr:efflux RND transporter periplasmic adaptor subunit [Blastocatellia bacterium]